MTFNTLETVCEVYLTIHETHTCGGEIQRHLQHGDAYLDILVYYFTGGYIGQGHSANLKLNDKVRTTYSGNTVPAASSGAMGKRYSPTTIVVVRSTRNSIGHVVFCMLLYLLSGTLHFTSLRISACSGLVWASKRTASSSKAERRAVHSCCSSCA